MDPNAPETSPPDEDAPRWTALSRNERRVLGVLVEKAKTTPGSYPLTLNGLVTGCNQKSNRFPQVEFDEGHVDDALEALRERRAVTFVQGDSRVEKYRHLAYEWLGVDKTELAVMAELLLRGAQTVGELRGRASRMEPIKGMGELQPVLTALVEKNLVLYLSPPGRGAVVTHNLYEPQELERVKRDHAATAGAAASTPASAPAAPPTTGAPAPVAPASAGGDWRPELAALRAEFEEQLSDLRAEVEQLRQRVTG